MTVAAPASVFARSRFWGAEQCARVRSAVDRGQSSPAEIYDGGYRVNERIRRTFEVDVDPRIVSEVERAFTRVRPLVSRFFGTPLVGAEGPGFLRYPPGGFYAAHRDCIPGAAATFPRCISLVLFLADAGTASRDGCEGGSLRLHVPSDEGGADTPHDIAPAAGTLVAFPATWLHEVLPVTSGVRDAIVDWFY